MLRITAATALILATLAIPAVGTGGPLSEPRLSLPHVTAGQQPHLALTLDACSGKADQRIISALIDNNIPATIFVTARWLRRNGEAVKLMLAHPDLFQIENHGGRHVPAVGTPMKVFGIAAAGSPAAVKAEVESGSKAILAATGHAPRWYRGATGRYDTAAMTEIRTLGQAIAGYSLRADDGASLSAAAVTRRLLDARDGDVIIAHMNHPEKSSGAGLVRGIMALKARGYLFVKLGPPPKPPAAAHAS